MVKDKENKNMRIASEIELLQVGDKITPTALAKKTTRIINKKDNSIHPDTLRDFIDVYDSLKLVGFQSIRDKNGFLRLIVKTEPELDLKREIREVKKEILDIKNILDELNKR